jgi:hypothetical protein
MLQFAVAIDQNPVLLPSSLVVTTGCKSILVNIYLFQISHDFQLDTSMS